MINRWRRRLYATARILGDVNAFIRGPRAFVARFVRKEIYKIAAPRINKLK